MERCTKSCTFIPFNVAQCNKVKIELSYRVCEEQEERHSLDKLGPATHFRTGTEAEWT